MFLIFDLGFKLLLLLPILDELVETVVIFDFRFVCKAFFRYFRFLRDVLFDLFELIFVNHELLCLLIHIFVYFMEELLLQFVEVWNLLDLYLMLFLVIVPY